MIQAIIEAMKAEIRKYNLELLQRYPRDLEIDMRMLEAFAYPGAKFCWMVGDSHTHSAPIGVHPKRNELPTYVTRLANNDRFYVLTIGHGPDQFTLKEVQREEFAPLAHTPIPYKMEGDVDSFFLFRNGSRIGYCLITAEGTYEKRVWKMALTPERGISKLDRAVLEEWGQNAVTKKAGSLFAMSRVEWQDEPELRLAA